MPEAPYGRSNRWLTVILITPEEFGADPSTIFRTYGAGREAVRLALEAENIEARPVWKPMHMQPVFQVERLKAEGSPEKWPPDFTGQARLKARENDPQISQITRINGRPDEIGKEKTFHWVNKKAQKTQNKNTYKARAVGGEVAEDLFERGLCLPSGTAMTEEDLDRVVETILNCRKK
jgi:dTDP-4-amino-4,6-dideoxygalactose transaminase